MFLGIGAKQCVPELAQRLLNLIQRVADLTLQKTCCGLFWFLLSWHINCVCVCLSSMSYFTPRKFLNPTRAIYIYIYMYLNIQYTYIINKSYNLGAHSLVDFFHVNRWSGWDFWWPQVTAPALVPPKAGIAWPRKRQANCWRPWQTSSRSQQRCTKASIWRKMLPSWMPKMLARKCGYVNLCANVCMWLY